MTVFKNAKDGHFAFAANLKDLEKSPGGCLTVHVENHTIALFYYNSKVYAIDNRCPHMGFPLNRGTVKDGVLTCHWHHARFDLGNGGTFDQWAGDVPSFQIEIHKGNIEEEIWVDISQSSFIDTSLSHQMMLLQNGLKQNISLLISKAVIAMMDDIHPIEKANKKEIDSNALIKAFRLGLDFGTHYKKSGWGQGLTILTSMMNIISYLEPKDKSYALYHGLSAIAQDCASSPPRFEISPLPKPWPDLPTLKRWFRQFIESRDTSAAERCIVTAVRCGANSQELSDILFTAVTDHRFLGVGHTLDYTNKALEALDIVEWNNNDGIVESVLSSLISDYTSAERMEESNAWRYPIDLIAILEKVFTKLPTILENTPNRKERDKLFEREKLVAELLGDISPQSIVNQLLDALNQGVNAIEISDTVTYAAAMRIAQFHTRNEFSDWDTALHTFTFANAVNQGLRRTPTPELLRGVFDAAMRIYLNRFLNIPPAKIPKPNSIAHGKFKHNGKSLLNELSELLDRQQQTNQVGQLVADYLYNDGNREILLHTIGKLLLREDRNFHSIQMIDAAFKQCSSLMISQQKDKTTALNVNIINIMIAASRYLAAHSPTMRSQGRTFQISNQLHNGEHLFE
jgi:nitrite reductase/ring-hydroxylating ferredoxin subunit